MRHGEERQPARQAEERLAHALRENIHAWLAPRLQGVLGQLDDSLFRRAVEAPAREEQDAWFAAMQELRARRAAFTAHVRRIAGEPRSPAVPCRPVRSDAGAMRWHAVLAPIAADSRARHAATLGGLVELLKGRDVPAPLNAVPVPDPEWLARCLATAAAAESIPLFVAEAFAGACEAPLFREIDVLYAQCAGLLLDAGLRGRAGMVTALPTAFPDLEELLPEGAGPERTRRFAQWLAREMAGDEAFAPRVRALFAGLEPVLVAAVTADRRALASPEHPLRCAIAAIGALGLGIGEREALDSDHQFVALSGFVRELRAAGDGEDALQRVGARIARFAAEEARQARLAQQRSETAEQARVLSQAAHAAIERELARELGHCRLPSAAEELLREGWRRVLVHALLDGGSEGAGWRNMLDGVRRFVALWRTGAACIPQDLADALAEAMLHAGCDPLRGEILLRSATEELASWDPPPPPPELMLVEEPAEPAADALPERALHAVDALARDAWIAFRDAGGEQRRARFALRCGEPAQLLFVDRYGRRALSIPREEFAGLLAAGQARALEGGDALARALDRLRGRLQRQANAA